MEQAAGGEKDKRHFHPQNGHKKPAATTAATEEDVGCTLAMAITYHVSICTRNQFRPRDRFIFNPPKEVVVLVEGEADTTGRDTTTTLQFLVPDQK